MIWRVVGLRCAPAWRSSRVQGPSYGRLEHGGIVWLVEVTLSAQAKSSLCRFGGRIGGHHKDREFRSNLPDAFQNAETILIRKGNIQED